MEAYAACSERKSARTVEQAHGGAHARGILQPKDGAHHVQATREIRGQAPRAQASQPGHRTWRDRGGPLSGKIRAVLAGPRRVKSPRPPSLVRRVVGGPPAALEKGKHKSHAASELPFELRRSVSSLSLAVSLAVASSFVSPGRLRRASSCAALLGRAIHRSEFARARAVRPLPASRHRALATLGASAMPPRRGIELARAAAPASAAMAIPPPRAHRLPSRSRVGSRDLSQDCRSKQLPKQYLNPNGYG